MPTIAAGGVWLRWDQVGDGDPVLLVHGARSDAERTWRRTGVVRALLQSGRRVVTVDCRGHGESGGPRDVFALEPIVADLVELLRYANARRMDLVAHAEGAGAALSLAGSRPGRFRSVTLVAPDASAVAVGTSLATPLAMPLALVAAGAPAANGPETLLARLLGARLLPVPSASPDDLLGSSEGQAALVGALAGIAD